jgi:hypothetical protein
VKEPTAQETAVSVSGMAPEATGSLPSAEILLMDLRTLSAGQKVLRDALVPFAGLLDTWERTCRDEGDDPDTWEDGDLADVGLIEVGVLRQAVQALERTGFMVGGTVYE